MMVQLLGRFNPMLVVSAVIALSLAGCTHEPIVDEVPYSGSTSKVIYFIRASEAGMDIDSAALPGVLTLVDGCLRVGWTEDMERAPTVVWPHEFSLRVSADQRIEILDAEGEIATWVGDMVFLEGSAHSEIAGDTLSECRGPYWTTGPNINDPLPTATFIYTPVPEDIPFATVDGSCHEQGACLDP